MDDQGEQILGTYLYGGGIDHDVEDPMWTEYMEAHPVLRGTLLNRLKDIVTKIANLKKPGRYPISDRFPFAFPENSGFSGYALLHGTKKNVGDFLMAGFAEVGEADDHADGANDIEMDLRFVFNDIVNPNKNYVSDQIRNIAAFEATLGQATSYRLSINWGSNCLAKVRPGQEINLFGYPGPDRNLAN